MDEETLCPSCKYAEVSWTDCDIHKEDCYAMECDTPFGCGFVLRDCEELEVVNG